MPAYDYALGVIVAPLPFVGHHSTIARHSIKMIMAKKSICFSLIHLHDSIYTCTLFQMYFSILKLGRSSFIVMVRSRCFALRFSVTLHE